MQDAADKGRAGIMFSQYLTVNGEMKTLRDWSMEFGIPYQTMWRRVKDRLPLHKIIHQGNLRWA